MAILNSICTVYLIGMIAGGKVVHDISKRPPQITSKTHTPPSQRTQRRTEKLKARRLVLFHQICSVVMERFFDSFRFVPSVQKTSPTLHILDPRGSSRLDVLAHHGNHQVEQTNGFDESETQNGVGEELTTQSRVAGDTEEEGTEDETDTDTGTTETDGGRAHTHVLGDLDHGVGDFRGVLAAGLDVGEDLASVGLDEAGLLTLDGLEGGHGESGLALGGEGPLRSQLETSGRTSNLGGCGHLGGQARGKDTRGGHCDFCGGVFFF